MWSTWLTYLWGPLPKDRNPGGCTIFVTLPSFFKNRSGLNSCIQNNECALSQTHAICHSVQNILAYDIWKLRRSSYPRSLRSVLASTAVHRCHLGQRSAHSLAYIITILFTSTNKLICLTWGFLKSSESTDSPRVLKITVSKTLSGAHCHTRLLQWQGHVIELRRKPQLSNSWQFCTKDSMPMSIRNFVP